MENKKTKKMKNEGISCECITMQPDVITRMSLYLEPNGNSQNGTHR